MAWLGTGHEALGTRGKSGLFHHRGPERIHHEIHEGHEREGGVFNCGDLLGHIGVRRRNKRRTGFRPMHALAQRYGVLEGVEGGGLINLVQQQTIEPVRRTEHLNGFTVQLCPGDICLDYTPLARHQVHGSINVICGTIHSLPFD